MICIDGRVAKRLGLSSVDRKLMQMADGSGVIATSYLARMTIQDLEFDDFVEVYGVPMASPSQRVLLGRSFLRNYIVTYHGVEEKFYYARSLPTPRGGEDEFDG